MIKSRSDKINKDEMFREILGQILEERKVDESLKFKKEIRMRRINSVQNVEEKYAKQFSFASRSLTAFCNICCEEVHENDIKGPLACKHSFCHECYINYLKEKISTNDVKLSLKKVN